ncbi:MAG: hypothetical protein EXQ70_11845 [Solirubrobacterales bacterium]|nr:hypothetical protein [Solirubrobacterales bacterium]
MSGSGPLTIVAERGVLTFDGAVIEAFGFGKDGALRMHVAFLDKIKLDEGGRFSDASVGFHSTKQILPIEGIFTAEEFTGPELAELVKAVKSAAPNLEE